MQKWFSGPRVLAGPGSVFAAVALIVALGACYPGDISGLAETDVVLTVHSGNDFSVYNTYAMPDTVVDVCENVDDPECENALDIDHSYDQQILAQIAARMQGYGYQRVPINEVDENNLPDVFVIVSVSATERTSTTVWYPWWGWGGWWPGWGPGWGPGYPAVSVTRWNQGTLQVTMIDPTDTDPDQQIFNVQWDATLSGVLSSANAPIDTNRIDRGIQQAFDQSTYLNTN
ncbi:MAG: DUF4136 domain-containing protein [Gemmatimonadota bacterium]|jgi:hypothetical protein